MRLTMGRVSGRATRALAVVALAGFVGAGVCLPGAATAQEDQLREDLDKVLANAKSSFLKAIEGLVRDQEAHRRLVAEMVEVLQKREAKLTKRIDELEKALAEKEKRIAALEKRLKSAAKPPAKPPVAKKPTNAFLGVGHVDHEKGAFVTVVQEGSPADRAGIKARDIITAVAGKPVNSESLGAAITGHRPGESVAINIERDGKEQKLEAKLVDREKFQAAQTARVQKPSPAKPVFLGIWVEETPAGVVVDEVEDGYTGDVAGLDKGDRIVNVNKKKVETNDQLAAVLQKTKAGEELVLVTRRGDVVRKITVVGSAEKGKAKLVGVTEEKPKEEKKSSPPEKAQKPGFLGVGVVADEKGLRVTGVLEGSAAAKAGIRTGDILEKANGKDLKSVDDLLGVLKASNAGDKIQVVLRRGDQSREMAVVLGVRPTDVEAVERPPQPSPKPDKPAPPKPPAAKKRGVLGITAQEIGDPVDHVVILEVTAGSAAEKAELKPGDVLVRVGDRAIKNFDDLAAALEKRLAGDEVVLRVKREGEEKDVKVVLGEP